MPSPVLVRRETVTLPTYLAEDPDPNPMFLEKRVYQGSSGKVYPLPCTDRVAASPTPHDWDAVYLENEYILVMLLPQLGGRIHRILDKTNHYDAVYFQPVIKPALVGLAGPWCSGGIEFNWPQHHRPSTAMPTEVQITREENGGVTVWMSEHDPLARMKGMHGVHLEPGRSLVEVRARAYNRTQDVQTFHWWANVATEVHEGYQSFFPSDVQFVADHAKRATTTFPHADGSYYGVDYGRRARKGVPPSEWPRRYRPPHAGGQADTRIPEHQANDLSWYANIPVPTSYMCMGSEQDFFGGYDYKARAGILHVANRHIAPGKKQWTWGNQEFGYAWDRNLTDADERGEHRPYIELMAGVYTDNQPDFSFLQPGETKSWSQYWYPFREIGPVTFANTEAALSLKRDGKRLTVGIATTAAHAGAQFSVHRDGKPAKRWKLDLSPASPARLDCAVETAATGDRYVLTAAGGKVLLDYTPKKPGKVDVPPPATEAPMPEQVTSQDELFFIGQHLEQYRHATRLPEIYWREALRRDPGDARCNLALGRWHLRRGEYRKAEMHLRASIARSTSRNPNPYDGEPHYQLGLCLRRRAMCSDTPDTLVTGLVDEAYAAFYKATWNHAWQAAAYHALAEIDCSRTDWATALEHLDRALQVNSGNLRAHNLKAVVLLRLGRAEDSRRVVEKTLALDPLDPWARHLASQPTQADNQTLIDLAFDYARAGLIPEALKVLDRADLTPGSRLDGSLGTASMIHYVRAWLCSQLEGARARASLRPHLRLARVAPAEYCFPSRLEELAVLEWALQVGPDDARASLYLGHLLYDRRRHEEAITHWERAVRHEASLGVAWRNLGIAYFNVRGDTMRARRAYNQALKTNPHSARYLYERDQLSKRLGERPAKRLRTFRAAPALIERRDDLALEYCRLCNLNGESSEALHLLTTRHFQPWEGGEGQVLDQHVRTHLALGRAALAAGKPENALTHFRQAYQVPENLGEARHPLANCSDIHYWLGQAYEANGQNAEARREWTKAAEFRGDFQGMKVRAFSEMTYYSALALQRLERKAQAQRLLKELAAYARTLTKTPATIDYFATSLPTMLLFNDDLQERQTTQALFLEAQALHGLGRKRQAKAKLQQVLRRDPSHELAADLLNA